MAKDHASVSELGPNGELRRTITRGLGVWGLALPAAGLLEFLAACGGKAASQGSHDHAATPSSASVPVRPVTVTIMKAELSRPPQIPTACLHDCEIPSPPPAEDKLGGEWVVRVDTDSTGLKEGTLVFTLPRVPTGMSLSVQAEADQGDRTKPVKVSCPSVSIAPDGTADVKLTFAIPKSGPVIIHLFSLVTPGPTAKTPDKLAELYAGQQHGSVRNLELTGIDDTPVPSKLDPLSVMDTTTALAPAEAPIYMPTAACPALS